MKQVLSQSIVSGGNRSVFTDYALEFNGTDEYLQIALPSDVASFNPATISGGNPPTGWTKYGASTITYETSEIGSSGCMKMVTASNLGILRDGLTIGKKYKLVVRYKGASLLIGRNGEATRYKTFGATSEWNTVTLIFTPDTFTHVTLQANGTIFIESVSIKEDQGFDFNKDQEQILHSKNWDFERTLGAEIAGSLDFNTWTVAGGGVIVDANSLSASAVGGVWKTLLTVGKKYIVTVSGTNNHTGTLALRTIDAGVPYQTIGTIPNGAFNVSFEFLADYTGLYFRFPEASTGNLDVSSLSLKEIPNLVTNGSFTGGSTGWSLGTDWTYGSDKVTKTAGTASAVSQAIQSVSGKRYRISFEVKDYSAGSVYALAYGNQVGTARTANGVFSYDITAGSTNTSYGVYCDATFAGSVDNIHIYEIPEWTASGNHSCDVSILDKSSGTQSLKVTASGAGDTSNCITLPSANLESCVSGKKYTLELFSRLDASSLSYGSDLFSSIVNGTTNPMENFSVTGNSFSASSAGVSNYQGCSINIPFSNGEIAKVTFTVSTKTGGNISVSQAINATGVGAIGTTETITGTGNYTLYFKIGSDSADYIQFNTLPTGAYSISVINIVITKATPITITAQLGTKSVTSSALSIVAGTFTKTVLNFLWEDADASAGMDLKLWLSGAGSVYVDKLSLTQRYDVFFASKFIKSGTSNHCLVQFGNSSTKPRLQIYLIGTDVFLGVQDNDSGTMLSDSSTLANPTSWHNLTFVGDSVNNSKMYVDGVENDSISLLSSIGKTIYEAVLMIGALEAGAAYHWQGQISHIQIIRFENISQSTFNSALTGLQYPTGGGAEEVLRLTFQDGSSNANMVKDYSPKGHILSMVNINLDNRCNVKEINRLTENTTVGSTYQYLTESNGQYIGVSY